MPTISIEEHPLRIIGGPTNTLHLYLVYTADNGDEYVVRSGPTNLQPIGAPMDIERNVPIADSADDRGSDTPADRHSTVLLSGAEADPAWGIIVKYAQALIDDGYEYRLFTENSNAFAGAMVRAAGLAPAQSLPEGIDREAAVGYAYWRTIVHDVTPPKDGTLVGSARADALSGIQIADVVAGRWGADSLWGGSGADRLYGGAGHDRVAGQGGDDLVRGDDGNDRLLGGANHDRLLGGRGADVLIGGGGGDRLAGNTGNDHLIGGAGADVFLFASGGGTDSVADFRSGTDVLRISATGVDDFSDLQIMQFGGDVRVGFLGGSIVLEHTDVAELHASDFVFAPPDGLLA